ncbi:MAG: barstar family protein [Pseudomonadota bacterium]
MTCLKHPVVRIEVLPRPQEWSQWLRELNDSDTQTFVLDGSKIINRDDLFQVCAQTLAFPEWFGHNWDAFEDCLGDLSWFPTKRFVLIYLDPRPLARSSPQDWTIASKIFETVSRNSQGSGFRLSVMLCEPED